jgi:hypothetical protein
LCGIAQCQHFGMRGRVVARNWRIKAAPDDFSVFYHYRPHGHLTRSLGLTRKLQSMVHVICIRHKKQGVVNKLAAP